MRTPEQNRFGSAHHEAAHATMAFLLGHPIDSVELFSLEAIPEEGDPAGCVHLAPREIANRWDAIEEIEVLLAGEAGIRTAWALKALSNEDIGGEEIPDAEITLTETIVASNGSTPAERASYLGWYDRADHPDEVTAQAIALEWSINPFEAETMLAYARAHVTAVVQTERFQTLMGLIAAALLEYGEMKGSHVEHLLQRADDIHRTSVKLGKEEEQ